MRSAELVETALSMRGVALDADDSWTTFEVIENGELERPLHHAEKILEQVLEWSTLDFPSSAFLVIKKFAGAKRGEDEKDDQKQFVRGDSLKFNDGSSKLLTGHKFQDKYVALCADKLLLHRDIKSTKAEKVIPLKSMKCYLGLRKKLKPPSSWGFTIYSDKQQWHLCCERREAQVSWVTDIIRKKYGSDLCSKTVKTKDTSDHKSYRGGAVAEGRIILPHNLNTSKQLGDKGHSLSGGNHGTTEEPGPRKTTLPRPKSLLRAAEVLRRPSADAGQPPRRPSPPPSRHLPVGGAKRPALGGEGLMPPNLLNELKSAMSKTGRSGRNNEEKK